MHLQESGEMYLETILVLTSQSPHVRAIDVGEYMGYSKPSVSRAMGLLKNGGYIKVDENGFITLLEPGREVAAEDACKLEHVISDESFQAIKKHAHLGVEK